MRLTDLLGVEVIDQEGRSAGQVHDVRLVQDGPLVGGFGASLRVAGWSSAGAASAPASATSGAR